MKSLERIVNPLIEPVTSSDVKVYTRVDGNTEDTFINTWIRSGRIKAENYQRKAYITQDWRLTLDAFPATEDRIVLPRGPLQSVVSVVYKDSEGTEVTFDKTKLLVDTDTQTLILKKGEVWPVFDTGLKLDNMKIVFRSGYGDNAGSVPEYVADALYVYCAYRYENRLGESDVIPRLFYQILDEERKFCGF